MTIYVTSDFFIENSEIYDGQGTIFQVGPTRKPIEFFNDGTIGSIGGDTAIAVSADSTRGAIISDGYVRADADVMAMGFQLTGNIASFTNSGTIDVTSQSRAYGVFSTANFIDFSTSWLIRVHADDAIGVYLETVADADIQSSVDIYGGIRAIGVLLGLIDGDVTVQAGIRVWSASTVSYGLLVGQSTERPTSANVIINGEIVADVAVGAWQGGTPGVGSDDQYIISYAALRGDVELGRGDDVFIAIRSEVTGTIDMGIGNDRVDVRTAVFDHGFILLHDGDDRALGSAYSETIFGMSGHDVLSGYGGDDVLDGGTGDDFLRGGLGADQMIGGAGDDRYEVDNVGDQVVEASSSGRDWVYSSISYVLPANVEALTLTGEDWINATGNTKGNAIYGNSGRNVITGGRGSDVMTGKASSDTFVFTSIADSTLDDSDRITDLNDTSDKLDFRQIDGDVNTVGVQGFTVVDAFTGHAGELVLSYDASTNITALTVDVNGDGVADMLVRLNGEHESFDRFLFGGG